MWAYNVVRQEVVEALQYNLAFLTLHHDAVQLFLDKSSDLAPSIVLTARASLEITRLCIDTNAQLNYLGYDWLESVVRNRPWDHPFTQDMCWQKIEEMKGPNQEVINELFRLRRDAENFLNYDPNTWPSVGLLTLPTHTSVWSGHPPDPTFLWL